MGLLSLGQRARANAAEAKLQATEERLRECIQILGHLHGYAQRRFDRYPEEREYLAELLGESARILDVLTQVEVPTACPEQEEARND